MTTPRCNHCVRCGVNWPPGEEFTQCPKCQVPTRVRAQEPHVTLAEARFEAYYHRVHEPERQERGDLDPDTLGVLEAHEQLAGRK